MKLPETARVDSGRRVHGLFVVMIPPHLSGFVSSLVVDAQGVLILVVAEEQVIALDVDCLSPHKIPESLIGCRFGSDVPEEDSLVPASAVEQVWVFGVPLDAEDPVGVGPMVPSFKGFRVSLVQMP